MDLYTKTRSNHVLRFRKNYYKQTTPLFQKNSHREEYIFENECSVRALSGLWVFRVVDSCAASHCEEKFDQPHLRPPPHLQSLWTADWELGKLLKRKLLSLLWIMLPVLSSKSWMKDSFLISSLTSSWTPLGSLWLRPPPCSGRRRLESPRQQGGIQTMKNSLFQGKE